MRSGLVVDSSAILAILFNEPEARFFAQAMAGTATLSLSAANWLETSIRVDLEGQEGLSHQFDQLIRHAGISVIEVSPDQASVARSAYRVFGKGNGHPAKLNFGDCFSYALAKTRNEPLLFKGGDFLHTDLELLSPSD